MPLGLSVVGAVVLVGGVVAAARYLDALRWRQSLVHYEMQLPSELTVVEVAAWFAAVAALTHAPRGVLVPPPPLVMMLQADHGGVRYTLSAPKPLTQAVFASLRAALPAARLEPCSAPTLTDNPASVVAAVTTQLAGRTRQLAVDRSEAASRALLAAVQPLERGERITWQWIMTGATTPAPVQQKRPNDAAVPWWLEEHAPADSDELRAARLKQRELLLHVTARLCIEAATTPRAQQLLGTAWGGVRLLNVPGARLVRGFWPSALVAAQLRSRWLPLFRWPLRVNALELAGLVALPVGAVPLPGVLSGVSKQVPPPREVATTGTVLADSTYPGMAQPLALSITDRMLQVALVGPTGVGKSSLMINMALQDAVQGYGLAVLDPKADMAADLLARLPAERYADVIVVNPADTGRPVGFNVLSNDGTETGRELAVDHVLHVFREQWKDFWGPRTDAVLRTGLLTLTNATASDGTAFTICELPALLTDDRFRRTVTSQPTVPPSVRDFWTWFEGLSRGERAQVVGPVLNKLTALTQRTPVRLLLGQSDGLDLAAAMQQQKILLMPLSRGLVGAETAALLSSLMMSSLWQAALGRARIATARRQPFLLYVDEASEVVRLPVDLADMLAEARGLKLGLTLAVQHLNQTPKPVRDALLGTVRSQIVFQVEPADARVLQQSFAPTLDEADLRNLAAYEVAMRLAAGGRTVRPVTGRTRPLPAPMGNGAELRAQSRERYGTPRADVETGLRRRLQVQQPNSPNDFGRRRAGGGRP